MSARLAALVAVLLGVPTARVGAQDFTPAAPAGPGSAAAVTLERGLPAAGGSGVETLFTSWLGVPGLTTRALCAAIAYGPARGAAGISRTGPDATGWDAAGTALGVVLPGGGAAVRAVVRREDSAAESPGGGATGVEAGGGAWVRAGRRLRVWASAPQVWTQGEAPPLPRALAIGAAVESDAVSAWLERESPARAAEADGRHAGGVLIDFGVARVWLEARERPTRVGLGLSLRTHRLGVRLRVEAHPVLGETVTLALGTVPGDASRGVDAAPGARESP